MSFRRFLFFALALAWASPAHAYAWMIRNAHTDCASCHADPSGGGLLTPYGRMQGRAVLIGADTDNVSPANDFSFGALPDALLLGVDYRGAVGSTGREGSGYSAVSYTQRQLDVAAELRLGRLRIDGSLGYDHDQALAAALTLRDRDNLISRTHWLGVALGEHDEVLLRAGRMNIPFGIRGPERTLFVRSPGIPGLGAHDDIEQSQQHGVALAYSSAPVRAEVLGILGNYQLTPAVYREHGYAGFVEWAVVPALALGVSSLVTHAERSLDLGVPLWRQAQGLFLRAVPWQPLVLLAEADLFVNSAAPAATPSGQAPTHSGYGTLLQADLEVWHGLHAIATLEAGLPAVQAAGTCYSGWASLAWFFAPHVDVRIDAIQQSVAVGAPRHSATSWSAQLHAAL